MKLKKVAAIIIIILSLQYYNTVIFTFTESTPFSGDAFYNPYQGLSQHWLKANFHAHTKLHLGLANGENTPEEMYERYDSLNYNFAGISNYNKILNNDFNRKLYFPIYEHGRNFGTIHQLVLNSEKVCTSDFLFWQSIHHKQLVINEQNKNGELIILAHPSFRTGYKAKDLKYLNNYHLFEIVSPRASSIELWDEALSSGHAVWGTGSDDAHDNTINNSGVCWSMVNSSSKTKKGILDALKSGKFYANRGWEGKEMNRIKSVTIKNNTYTLLLKHKSDSLILKSDYGKTIATALNTDSISYTFKPENTYIRAEVFDTEPWNTYNKMFLNPVIRTTDKKLIPHNNSASYSPIKTWIFRLSLLLFHLVLILILYKNSKINIFSRIKIRK